MKDLEFVERKLFALDIGKIGKVLYLTDGHLPDQIFNADLGTPLGWETDGVELYIVTRGSCTPWIERARIDASRCVSGISRHNADKFRDYLKLFEDSVKNGSGDQSSKQ